ncbi:hypothetical protein [Alicyclobacillus macrosporangiidus]|uniref:Uncharacterized protein n=1 Tax=Alicyclobacillus macrosporangiidus TaxID=392015 RepID=A0A1I7IC85_9BACL|nr:hypothetical protein [Alicyclobacillus macrosporangiidus]SFU70456.1 hypothetical protein SAMN05421543_106122 [Alicyclobacillus macrosporangiidus]
MSTTTIDHPTLDQKFQQYHQDNPHVYETLVRLARQMKARGHRRIGIKMLWETMRYQLMLDTLDPEGWKLNNNYPSRYARLIMSQEPDLAGIFETRELRS